MYICKDCFLDEELRSEVTSNAHIEGVCEICGSNGKLMDFSEFYDFFDALLSLFTTTDDANKTVVDIIQEEWHIFKDEKVAKTLLANVITNHHYGFTIDSNVDYISDIQDGVDIWNKLKNSVKENLRFFTNHEEFNLCHYLIAGSSLHIGQKLYRSRITPIGQKKLKCNQMGCPPKAIATAGRANPIGIPYLYLSDSAKTTYFEVRAVYLDRLSVGTFRIEQNLKLIDFIYDVNLFLSYTDGSIPLKETIIKKKVIDAISSDLSKPLRRYDSELEYVPTQFICEYCRHVVKADGISFESSLHKGGRNYVLFEDSSAKCIKVDSHEITRIDIDKE